MSEYEMIFMLSELVNRIWLLIQVWMGIAVGYMAVAHFYGSALSATQLVVVSLLFLLFTAAAFSTVLVSVQGIEGYHSELLELASSQGLAAGTQALLEARSSNIGITILIPASAMVTFVCAFLYMPYTYFAGRHKDS